MTIQGSTVRFGEAYKLRPKNVHTVKPGSDEGKLLRRFGDWVLGNPAKQEEKAIESLKYYLTQYNVPHKLMEINDAETGLSGEYLLIDGPLEDTYTQYLQAFSDAKTETGMEALLQDNQTGAIKPLEFIQGVEKLADKTFSLLDRLLSERGILTPQTPELEVAHDNGFLHNPFGLFKQLTGKEDPRRISDALLAKTFHILREQSRQPWAEEAWSEKNSEIQRLLESASQEELAQLALRAVECNVVGKPLVAERENGQQTDWASESNELFFNEKNKTSSPLLEQSYTLIEELMNMTSAEVAWTVKYSEIQRLFENASKEELVQVAHRAIECSFRGLHIFPKKTA